MTSLNCNPNGDCIGDIDFCSESYPCGEDQGDCDTHIECNTGLTCGTDNCPSHLGFSSTVDCCTSKSILLSCQDSSNVFRISCVTTLATASWFFGGLIQKSTMVHKGGLWILPPKKYVRGSIYNYISTYFSGQIVSCGGHYASSCQECPQGNGALGCNGVCVWSYNQCVKPGEEGT